MALIGTIRKNFWFVLILLGLALAAFLIMDSQMSGAPGGAVASSPIGSVNGKSIDYMDFQRTESAYFGGSNADPFVKKNLIWDHYVEKSLMQEESTALGIDVSYDELMDLQFGPVPSSIITNNGFKPEDLQNIRNQFESGDEVPVSLSSYWKEQEQQIILDSKKNKLNALVSKSVYTPDWMAQESFGSENDKAAFNFVKIPFEQIDAAGIEVSDADINNYVSTRKTKYEQTEETRKADYVVFNVIPTAADSNFYLDKVNELKTNLIAAENDSLFVTSNNGYYTHIYNKKDILPEGAREDIAALNPGEIFGPYAENGVYLLAKMLDKRVLPDTVTASHILRKADRNNPTQVARANEMIDSIWGVYRKGLARFDTLAVRHSEDGSSAKGGDLGPFVQETMVPEFANACFVAGKTGQIKKVQSDFGIHLIKITNQNYSSNEMKYRFALMSQDITPSQETQDNKLDIVSELITSNRDITSLKTALQNHPDVIVETTPTPSKINDFAIGSLGSGQTPRDMVKWIFNNSTEVGDVAPEVFSFTDPVKYYDNKYVILSLNSIVPKGMPSAEVLRSQIEANVLNQKKGEQLKSTLNVTSLEDLASQYGVEVQTAADVSPSRAFVPGVGNEPEVIGSAFDVDVQSISKPIVGESGVFVIQPTSKENAGEPTNLPFLKNSLATSTRSQVNFKLLQSMKKRAEITDSRAKFF